MRRLGSVSAVSSVLAAFALTAAAPVFGAEPPATTPPPEAAAKPADEAKPKEKPVCHTEAVTGSLRPKRVCRTQAQIDAQRQAVEDLNKERRETGATQFGDRSLTASGTLSGP